MDNWYLEHFKRQYKRFLGLMSMSISGDDPIFSWVCDISSASASVIKVSTF